MATSSGGSGPCLTSPRGTSVWLTSVKKVFTEEITNRSSKLEHYLVDVTPTPVLPWLEGLDNGVVRRVKVFGGVLILRVIAAANMPAFETEAQVYPRIPDSQTILTTVRAGCNLSYLV